MQEDNGKKQQLEWLSGPGIMWVNSKIAKPKDLSRALYTEWYDKVHIPDVLEVEGIVAGFRYESVEKDDKLPYLAIYSIPELMVLRENVEFKSVPHHHDMLPGGQSIYSYADFDCRFYKRVQTYERENTKEGRFSTLLSAAIHPATGTDDDFDRWYREEHLEMLSRCPGWRRSTRHELVLKAGVNDEYPNISPRWLAIHEYEEGTWPSQESDAVAKTEWSVQHLSNAKEFDGRVFKLCSEFGEINASL